MPGPADTELAGAMLRLRGVPQRPWDNRRHGLFSYDYMFGTTTVEGSGHTLRVWFKNENHVTWLDGRPWVLSPDLIMVLDAASGEPCTNTLLPEGASVGVIGARADDKLLTPRALLHLGPRRYGFDMEYTPIETLMGGR